MTVVFQRFNFRKGRLHFACSDIGPPDKTVILVEKKVALGVALRNKEGCGGGIVVEGKEVGIGKNIDVVNKDGLVVGKEACSLLQSPTRLEQHICLIAKLDVDAEAIIGFYKVDDLLGKVMNIDDDFRHTDALQFLYQNLYKRFTIDRHHRLGHSVRKGFQTSAKTGCKN